MVGAIFGSPMALCPGHWFAETLVKYLEWLTLVGATLQLMQRSWNQEV